MPTIPGLEGVDFAPVVSQVAYWFGILLAGIGIMVAMFVGYYLTSFPIKATVFPLYGSTKSGQYSIGVPKKNRIKWVDQKTAWKSMMPLFNKIKREPFDAGYIYQGKRVFVFDDGQQWIPGQITVDQTGEEMKAEIRPVPYYVRNWQSLQYKQHELEFAKMDFWTENKHLFITLGVVLFVCILVGTVVYFTYQYASGGREDMRLLTEAIRNIASVGGGNVPG